MVALVLPPVLLIGKNRLCSRCQSGTVQSLICSAVPASWHASGMLQRLFSGSRADAQGETAPAKPASPASQLAELQKQVEKLRGYYELSRVSRRLP